jgi:hypothetical protein
MIEGSRTVNNRSDERKSGMIRVEAWPARAQQPQMATLRNLSKRGLSARLASEALAGEKWTFVLPGLGEVAGTVAWASSFQVGVRLQSEIDVQRVFEAAFDQADKRPAYADTILSHVGQGKRPGLRSNLRFKN